MLGKRYINDGVPLMQLNDLQLMTKNQVDWKVHDGIYQFEKVSCCICNGKDFETVATKDRYGLYMPVVICTQCGLMQTNPRMNQKAYNEFYNSEYRKLYGGTKYATQSFFTDQYERGHNIFNFLQKNDALPKPKDTMFVLEVGCGAGGILQYFKEQGCRVKGIDLGEEYLEYGRSKYGLNLSSGTIADINLDEPPDLIIYSHVLEHVLELNDELQRVHEILSSNGIVYVELPGVMNIMQSYDMDFLMFLQNAHTYHFTLTSLENLMQRNHFELIAGSKIIRSVFKKREGPLDKPAANIINNYDDTLRYLNKVEYLRKLFPIAPYKALRLSKSLTIRALKLIGLYETMKGLYHRLQAARRT
jgi:2-polyprenyl-3-methyl-5-hydroxy-6-metoxy-1,4-benzoquinol methylase